ncbi:MAG: phosphoribosyltransferase [Blastocatellia bacterium]
MDVRESTYIKQSRLIGGRDGNRNQNWRRNQLEGLQRRQYNWLTQYDIIEILMSLERIPDFSESIRRYLRRSEWGDFPDVVIHSDESVVKKNQLYASAKAGDADAAEGLVLPISDAALNQIGKIIGTTKPCLLAVHALETEGMNAIPRVLAQVLSVKLGLPVARDIIQINRVTHTGASGYHRLAFPPLFDGDVRESEYLLVDDFIGQGGTLANLKGFVEANGARAIGATALTGKAYSAKLRLSEETLQRLREKYGTELEKWWAATFGYSFERLTESEARYLFRADNADVISERIVAARGKGD